jgi:hypothetical protein
MIWKAPEAVAQENANGSQKGLTNGWHGVLDAKAEEQLDPVAMQFC